VFAVIGMGEHGLRTAAIAGLVVAATCVAGIVVRERHAGAPMLPLGFEGFQCEWDKDQRMENASVVSGTSRLGASAGRG
jgi:hypothetical protein